MSFGFSVGDFVATSQLCFSIYNDSKFSNSRATSKIKNLSKSLSLLGYILTSNESNNLLTQEEFQKPLRDGLTRIRRDLQAFEKTSQSWTDNPPSLSRARRRSKQNDLAKKIEAQIDQLSEDTDKLRDLLEKAAFSKANTSNQELLLSIRSLAIADSAEEDSKVSQWLAGSSQEDVHTALVSMIGEQAGAWTPNVSGYEQWKHSQNSLLLLWGIPGSGKSVLSASIVRHLRLDTASSQAVAFYHFSASRGPEGSSLERCLMSLIGQLSSKEAKVPIVVRRLYRDFAGGTELPKVQALQETMVSLLSLQPSCYIVLDGIDESSKLNDTLNVINSLRSHGTESAETLHILVTSRIVFEIEAVLSGAFPREYTMSATVDPTSDIKNWTQNELDRESGKFQKLSPELKGFISDTIVENSNGIFLCAHLAFDRLRRAPTINAVRKVLRELPPGMVSIYDGILQEIPPQNHDIVRRVLIWIMNSARELTVAEMSDAIVLNTTGEMINPDDRLIDSDVIMRTCSSFLVQNNEGIARNDTLQPVLRLIHVSFKEFLRSQQSQLSPFLDLQHSDGDRILLDCCVSYLLSFDRENSVPDGDLTDTPLLTYAAEYWPYHARRVENAGSWHPKTTRLIIRLFNDNNGIPLSNWLKALDPAAPEGPAESVEKPNTIFSPLLYASSLGLRHVLESLFEVGGRYSAAELEACLHAASYNGNAEIVRFWLQQGTNPNAEHWSDGRPLDAAILKRHQSVVRLLIQYGADMTYGDRITGSPFQTAVSNGDASLVNLILGPLKQRMSSKVFLEVVSLGLRDAARKGYLEVVQLLFNADENGDVDAPDEAGFTALHYAIRYKCDDVQQYLIDHGADIDKRNLAGESPADFAWSDRRLDLSLYNKVIDLKKKANQAFSCHILQQVSDSGECHKSVFRKTFHLRKQKPKAKKKAARIAIIREHTILQKINHPFIVSYLWYEEDNDQETAQLYLEYCNGGDLDRYSARAIEIGDEEESSDESDRPARFVPHLVPKELWRYMYEVAAALAYLHHGLSLRLDQVFTFERQWNQILHRDIKPSNIVLDVPPGGQRQAKLCDLGLAKGLNPKIKEAKETNQIGTRSYWPLEVHKGGHFTAKGDISSYGSTFMDLWTRSAVSDRECHPPKTILEECMSDEPADRPSSIKLLEILREHVAEELPLSTSNLHGLLGQSQFGYLYDALYMIAGQFDTKEGFGSRSVKFRRKTLISRLEKLCDDGAGQIFDTQQGSPKMRLHVAVLLNREVAFSQTLKVPAAINSRWSSSGWTPLHLAAQEGNLEMFHRLIEAKADAYVLDNSGHIAGFYLP